MRRSKHSSLKNKGLGKIVYAISISKRPASVEDRAIPGHWEGDLIQGINNTFIATLVERHSRYVMLAKLKNKNTEIVIAALIKQSKKLPKELYKLLTWDRGSDLSIHTQSKLSAVARQLNERPRKTLEYETPVQKFNACVASTG